jgi:hypothetical protein
VAAHDDSQPEFTATMIGRDQWREHGALALRRTSSGFAIGGARDANFDRPWAPAITPRRVSDANADQTALASAHAAPCDTAAGRYRSGSEKSFRPRYREREGFVSTAGTAR